MSDQPPSKFAVVPMTPAEAGAFLRRIAETTAVASNNWDNFEAIAALMIESAFKAGKDSRDGQ